MGCCWVVVALLLGCCWVGVGAVVGLSLGCRWAAVGLPLGCRWAVVVGLLLFCVGFAVSVQGRGYSVVGLRGWLVGFGSAIGLVVVHGVLLSYPVTHEKRHAARSSFFPHAASR